MTKKIRTLSEDQILTKKIESSCPNGRFDKECQFTAGISSPFRLLSQINIHEAIIFSNPTFHLFLLLNYILCARTTCKWKNMNVIPKANSDV